MSDVGMQSVAAQEQAPKPVLHPSPGLGAWLNEMGGIGELYDVGFLSGITRPYTPGFSEPDLHRGIMHGMPGIFPFAAPRPQPDEQTETPNEETSP